MTYQIYPASPPSLAVSPERVPVTSETAVWWMDEPLGSLTYAEAITPGAARDLTTLGTNISAGIYDGETQPCGLWRPGSVRASGAPAVNPTNNATSMSIWVVPSAIQAQCIAIKAYRLGSWLAPFLSFGLFNENINGDWSARLSIGGALVANTITNAPLRVGIPTLLGMTYDGADIRAYFNGVLVSTTAAVGVIDWGTNGDWCVGAAETNANPFEGRLWELRVWSSVVQASVLRNIYLTEMGLAYQ